MSAETGVYAILSGSADLAAAAGVPPEQLPELVRRAGAIDPPDRWLAIRWEEPTLYGPLGTPRFTLRAHDRNQESYSWVDGVLNAAKRTLTAVVHQHGITQIDWSGRSPDLIDDGYRSLTKYDTYVVLAGLTTGRD